MVERNPKITDQPLEEQGLEGKLYSVDEVVRCMRVYAEFRKTQAALEHLHENSVAYKAKLEECKELFNMYKQYVPEKVRASLRGGDKYVNFEIVFESFMKRDEEEKRKTFNKEKARKIREECELSPQVLAKMIGYGLTRYVILHYERGRLTPNPEDEQGKAYLEWLKSRGYDFGP